MGLLNSKLKNAVAKVPKAPAPLTKPSAMQRQAAEADPTFKSKPPMRKSRVL